MSSEKYKCFKLREVQDILKANGYTCIRYNKHYIWKNTEGNIISIPHSANPMVIRRVFKENNIII